MLSGAKSITMSGPKQPFYHAKGPQIEAKNGHFSNKNAMIFTPNTLNKLIINNITKHPYFRFKSTKDGVERK